MEFWHKKLYPLVALLAGLFIIICGLAMSKDLVKCSIFLLVVLVLLMIFGCLKGVLHVIPLFIVIAGIFFVIFYYATGSINSGWAMANRFGALFLGIVPGMSTSPVRMTRSLSQVHTPRGITLGMLIAMSFVPMLKGEIKRVREAMKTRGAGSILNIKILYRAFLIPFVMRLVNISDTLALSVETRGFSLGKTNYTIYKKEKMALSDIIFILALIACEVLVIVL